MEEEADRVAPIVLYYSKFDPRVYVSHLQLYSASTKQNPKILAQLNSLHPDINKRIKWSKAAILKLPPFRDPVLSSESFRRIKAILKEVENRNPTPKT